MIKQCLPPLQYIEDLHTFWFGDVLLYVYLPNKSANLHRSATFRKQYQISSLPVPDIQLPVNNIEYISLSFFCINLNTSGDPVDQHYLNQCIVYVMYRFTISRLHQSVRTTQERYLCCILAGLNEHAFDGLNMFGNDYWNY